MNHTSVYDPLPAPAAKDSDTSVEAAKNIGPVVPRLQKLVLETVAKHPAGVTREEIEALTGLDGNTVRPRVRELLDEGKLAIAPYTGRTKHGNRCDVLLAVVE